MYEGSCAGGRGVTTAMVRMMEVLAQSVYKAILELIGPFN